VVPPTAPARPSDTTPKPAVGVFGATPLSEAEERALAPKQSFKECDTCPEMVVLPAGWFTMGSPLSEREREPSEGPQHRVTISQQFAVGKFEVTVDQFAEFVKDSGYVPSSKCWTFEDGKLELRPGRSWRNPGVVAQSGWHPAICTSWNDAKAYVAWLSRKTGKDYRLLSEAEWEYAARAGTGTRFNFGDNYNLLCGYGNGADQRAKRTVPGAASWPAVPCDDGFAYTAPVGSFAANGFGLYDMHGNAWEWIEDCWNANYSGAPTDGSAWTGGDCNFRILRGGGWGGYPQSLRAAYRFKSTGEAGDAAGFRVARTLAP
jgi:formylglycine-generating enzyme required for sulfatase activity